MSNEHSAKIIQDALIHFGIKCQCETCTKEISDYVASQLSQEPQQTGKMRYLLKDIVTRCELDGEMRIPLSSIEYNAIKEALAAAPPQQTGWQLCPKCFGEGIVDQVGTSTSCYRICPVCNGAKLLVPPQQPIHSPENKEK
jgi:hypothetical protein